MTEPVTHSELIRIITDIAKRGHINTSEVQSASDVGITRKFSSYFRAAIEGVSDEAALKAVKAVAAKGKRTLRKGVGLWLTDKEFASN